MNSQRVPLEGSNKLKDEDWKSRCTPEGGEQGVGWDGRRTPKDGSRTGTGMASGYPADRTLRITSVYAKTQDKRQRRVLRREERKEVGGEQAPP